MIKAIKPINTWMKMMKIWMVKSWSFQWGIEVNRVIFQPWLNTGTYWTSHVSWALVCGHNKWLGLIAHLHEDFVSGPNIFIRKSVMVRFNTTSSSRDH